jgi:hypothetical protein
MSVMGLGALMEKCKGLDVYERRVDKPEYQELVVFHADLSRWQEFFKTRYGTPAKPMGVEPNDEQLRLTDTLGGIRRQQILFTGREDGRRVVAMIWPWEDKEHVTLKIALLP